MDSRAYKQGKTAWRLVLRFCSIETAVTVFQTCRENRELSNEESLWKEWYLRDFGPREGDKSKYITLYSFGFNFMFKAQECATSFDPERIKKVKYIFLEKGNYFITLGEIPSLLTKDYRGIGRGPFGEFCDKRGKYFFDSEKATISRIRGKKNYDELKKIPLFLLIRWIRERFKVSEFRICTKFISFSGIPHNGYGIWKKDMPSIESVYIAHFDGKFTERFGAEVFATKDGIVECPPKII